MAKVRMLLSVREADHGALDRVAAAAELAGMAVDARMTEIGVVSGLIDDDKVDLLRKIDGVEDVQPDRTYSLPSEES